jgi:lipopolysaccharide/colanic/teichoic acid biosynthesis glycosyltransferase
MVQKASQTSVLESVRSTDQLQEILKRECARVDRNGQEFSFVVFDIRLTGEDDASLQHLLHTIIHRVRSTDEIGWFDTWHVGVVLSDTSADKAWKVTDDICQKIGRKASPPTCVVYSYPSQWLSDCDSNPRRSRFISTFSKQDSSEAPASPLSMKPTTGNDTTSSRQQTTVQVWEMPIAELKPLLVPPIPIWKRVMDIGISLLVLVICSPLFVFIALLIKMVSPGPIFFKQQRVGYLGKPFTFWKFRTMKVNADTSIHQQYVKNLIQSDSDKGVEKPMVKLDSANDPRIIPFGQFLRKTCLDELPQLFNVLRGNMSLVGPRPCIPYEAQNYLPWQLKRFDTIPGMTGLWQVSGKNSTTFKEMVRLDITYIRLRSFWLDVKIILKTVPAIMIESQGSFLKRKDA